MTWRNLVRGIAVRHVPLKCCVRKRLKKSLCQAWYNMSLGYSKSAQTAKVMGVHKWFKVLDTPSPSAGLMVLT